MARAHIQYPGPKAYEKKWCKPTGDVPARGTFAECLICSGVYEVQRREVYDLNAWLGFTYKNVWIRLTNRSDLRRFRRAKKLAAKHG